MIRGFIFLNFVVSVLLVLTCSCLDTGSSSAAHDFDSSLPSQVNETDMNGFRQMMVDAKGLIDDGRLNEAFVVLKNAGSSIDTLRHDIVSKSIPAHDLFLLNVYTGNIYTSYRDYRSAIKYYQRSLDFCESANDSINILMNIAVISSHSGDGASARSASNSLAKVMPLTSADSLYVSYARSVSNAYIEKFFGNREKSCSLFKECLETARRNNLSIYSRLTPVSELYEWYSSVDSLDRMIEYLEEYKQLAEVSRMPEMMADVNKGFMRAYILTGEKDKALAAYDSYFTVVDSLYDPTQFTSLNSRYSDADLSRSNDRLMRLELTVTRQKMIIFSGIVSGVLIFIVWVVIKKIRQSKLRIFFLNREIVKQESRKEQTVESSEASHRVDNAQEKILEEKLSNQADNERNDTLMRQINKVLRDGMPFCNPDFSINELAMLVNSNTKYVSQAINETTGMNFRMYINSLRISVARERIAGEGEYERYTIQALGESVGFRSASNFVIAFRKFMGLTPSAYRKLEQEA